MNLNKFEKKIDMHGQKKGWDGVSLLGINLHGMRVAHYIVWLQKASGWTMEVATSMVELIGYVVAIFFSFAQTVLFIPKFECQSAKFAHHHAGPESYILGVTIVDSIRTFILVTLWRPLFHSHFMNGMHYTEPWTWMMTIDHCHCCVRIVVFLIMFTQIFRNLD